MAGTFGNGAIFKLNATTISEITTISAPNLTAETIDVTTHSSANSYREFIKGLRIVLHCAGLFSIITLLQKQATKTKPRLLLTCKCGQRTSFDLN
jgi:hypothetical protein